MRRVHPALLATLAGVACAPELNWREWRSDEAQLSQMFPCKPVRQQRKVQLAGRELRLVLHVCDAQQVSWSVAHVDVGDPAGMGQALAALTEAAHVNLGAPRTASTPHTVAGDTPQVAAGRFVLRGQAPDGRSLQGAVLVFAKGTVAVQVTALGERLPREAVETFLGSTRAGS